MGLEMLPGRDIHLNKMPGIEIDDISTLGKFFGNNLAEGPVESFHSLLDHFANLKPPYPWAPQLPTKRLQAPPPLTDRHVQPYHRQEGEGLVPFAPPLPGNDSILSSPYNTSVCAPAGSNTAPFTGFSDQAVSQSNPGPFQADLTYADIKDKQLDTFEGNNYTPYSGIVDGEHRSPTDLSYVTSADVIQNFIMPTTRGIIENNTHVLGKPDDKICKMARVKLAKNIAQNKEWDEAHTKLAEEKLGKGGIMHPVKSTGDETPTIDDDSLFNTIFQTETMDHDYYIDGIYPGLKPDGAEGGPYTEFSRYKKSHYKGLAEKLMDARVGKFFKVEPTEVKNKVGAVGIKGDGLCVIRSMNHQLFSFLSKSDYETTKYHKAIQLYGSDNEIEAKDMLRRLFDDSPGVRALGFEPFSDSRTFSHLPKYASSDPREDFVNSWLYIFRICSAIEKTINTVGDSRVDRANAYHSLFLDPRKRDKDDDFMDQLDRHTCDLALCMAGKLLTCTAAYDPESLRKCNGNYDFIADDPENVDDYLGDGQTVTSLVALVGAGKDLDAGLSATLYMPLQVGYGVRCIFMNGVIRADCHTAFHNTYTLQPNTKENKHDVRPYPTVPIIYKSGIHADAVLPIHLMPTRLYQKGYVRPTRVQPAKPEPPIIAQSTFTDNIQLPPIDDLEIELPPIDDLEIELPPIDDLEIELPPIDDLEIKLPPIDDLEIELPPFDDLEIELPSFKNRPPIPNSAGSPLLGGVYPNNPVGCVQQLLNLEGIPLTKSATNSIRNIDNTTVDYTPYLLTDDTRKIFKDIAYKPNNSGNTFGEICVPDMRDDHYWGEITKDNIFDTYKETSIKKINDKKKAFFNLNPEDRIEDHLCIVPIRGDNFCVPRAMNHQMFTLLSGKAYNTTRFHDMINQYGSDETQIASNKLGTLYDTNKYLRDLKFTPFNADNDITADKETLNIKEGRPYSYLPNGKNDDKRQQFVDNWLYILRICRAVEGTVAHAETPEDRTQIYHEIFNPSMTAEGPRPRYSVDARVYDLALCMASKFLLCEALGNEEIMHKTYPDYVFMSADDLSETLGLTKDHLQYWGADNGLENNALPLIHAAYGLHPCIISNVTKNDIYRPNNSIPSIPILMGTGKHATSIIPIKNLPKNHLKPVKLDTSPQLISLQKLEPKELQLIQMRDLLDKMCKNNSTYKTLTPIKESIKKLNNIEQYFKSHEGRKPFKTIENELALNYTVLAEFNVGLAEYNLDRVQKSKDSDTKKVSVENMSTELSIAKLEHSLALANFNKVEADTNFCVSNNEETSKKQKEMNKALEEASSHVKDCADHANTNLQELAANGTNIGTDVYKTAYYYLNSANALVKKSEAILNLEITKYSSV